MMTWRGATMLMQWASEAPVRFVFNNDTMPPTRVIPSQIARYSGLFGMSRHTTAPFVRLCASAHRAYCRERATSAS